MNILKNKKFKECMVRASAKLLNDERYYKKPYDEMGIHQQVRCQTDAERALRMVKIAVINFKGLKK
jgi:hypothetical protein